MEQNRESGNRKSHNGKLMLKKGTKAIKQRLDNFLNKWCLDNWISICTIKEAAIHMLYHRQIMTQIWSQT